LYFAPLSLENDINETTMRKTFKKTQINIIMGVPWYMK